MPHHLTYKVSKARFCNEFEFVLLLFVDILPFFRSIVSLWSFDGVLLSDRLSVYARPGYFGTLGLCLTDRFSNPSKHALNGWVM